MTADINYVFDVDGTLTPSRLSMDEEFRNFFLDWIKDKKVYLLTGSDHTKTVEQVGQQVWESVTESHQCGGNVIYRKGQLGEMNSFWPDGYLLSYCRELIALSNYPVKAGNHVEVRTGLLNISVVGRDFYGVFPLRGKVINAREKILSKAGLRQVMDNAELIHMKQILALEQDAKYKDLYKLQFKNKNAKKNTST